MLILEIARWLDYCVTAVAHDLKDQWAKWIIVGLLQNTFISVQTVTAKDLHKD